MTNGQAQVADGATQIGLHQDVLALQISVGDAGLASALLAFLTLRLAVLDISPDDVHVEVSEAGCDCERHQNHRSRVDGVGGQEIEERAVFMVVGDQPQLRPCSVVFVVGGNESKDVVVSQHRCLIDFGFTCPRALFAAREDFDGNAFASPATAPDLPEATVADHLFKLNLTRNRTLNKQRQSSRARSRGGHFDDVVQSLIAERLLGQQLRTAAVLLATLHEEYRRDANDDDARDQSAQCD